MITRFSVVLFCLIGLGIVSVARLGQANEEVKPPVAECKPRIALTPMPTWPPRPTDMVHKELKSGFKTHDRWLVLTDFSYKASVWLTLSYVEVTQLEEAESDGVSVRARTVKFSLPPTSYILEQNGTTSGSQSHNVSGEALLPHSHSLRTGFAIPPNTEITIEGQTGIVVRASGYLVEDEVTFRASEVWDIFKHAAEHSLKPAMIERLKEGGIKRLEEELKRVSSELATLRTELESEKKKNRALREKLGAEK